MKKLRFVTTLIGTAAISAVFPALTSCQQDTADKVKVTLEQSGSNFCKDGLDVVKGKFYEFTINYPANLWQYDGKYFYLTNAGHTGPIALIDAETIYGYDSEGELVFGTSQAMAGSAVVNFSKGQAGCTKDQTIKICCQFTSDYENASIIFGQ